MYPLPPLAGRSGGGGGCVSPPIRLQACNGVHCFAHALWDGGLDAFAHQVGYELAHARVIVQGGDQAAAVVTLSGGLVEDGVGTDQAEKGAEVPAEPDCQGRNHLGEGLGVGDGDAARGRGTLKPVLEGVPGFLVRLEPLLLGEHGEDPAGLLAGVGDGEGKETGLVFGVELEGRSGDYEACGTFALYEAGFETVSGLLDRFVADLPFGEEGANEVAREVAAHPLCLVDHEEAVLYGLLGVGEEAFAHGGEGVVGAFGEVGEDTLCQVGFAARGGTLDGDANGLV